MSTKTVKGSFFKKINFHKYAQLQSKSSIVAKPELTLTDDKQDELEKVDNYEVENPDSDLDE